jgi:hypothetical protein
MKHQHARLGVSALALALAFAVPLASRPAQDLPAVQGAEPPQNGIWVAVSARLKTRPTIVTVLAGRKA